MNYIFGNDYYRKCPNCFTSFSLFFSPKLCFFCKRKLCEDCNHFRRKKLSHIPQIQFNELKPCCEGCLTQHVLLRTKKLTFSSPQEFQIEKIISIALNSYGLRRENFILIRTCMVDNILNQRDKETGPICALLAFFYSQQIIPNPDLNSDEKAFEYALKASQKKSIIGNCLLGFFYSSAVGIEKDEIKAKELYQRIVKEDPKCARGWYYLGLLKKKVPNLISSESFALYLKSAELGFPEGMENVGYAYHYGYGVKQDGDKAFFWYNKAAHFSRVISINNLGVCYNRGIGVQKNLKKAYELYCKASSLPATATELVISFYNLGNIHKSGNYVPKNLKKACFYYIKSSIYGSSFYIKNLKSLVQIARVNPKYYFEQVSTAFDEVTDNTKFFVLFERRRILTILLLARKYSKDSPFFHENLPLDILKIITFFSEIHPKNKIGLTCFEKRRDKLTKKIKDATHFQV